MSLKCSRVRATTTDPAETEEDGEDGGSESLSASYEPEGDDEDEDDDEDDEDEDDDDDDGEQDSSARRERDDKSRKAAEVSEMVAAMKSRMAASDKKGSDRLKVSEATELRRQKNLLGRAEDLWLDPDNLKFHTDSDISDVSEIWSDYGDEMSASCQHKMVRWNASRKNVADKLPARERAATVAGRGAEKPKKKRKRYTTYVI